MSKDMHVIYMWPDRSGYLPDMRADTLWNAICWGIRDVYADWEKGEAAHAVIDEYIADCVSGAPPFVISSAFPCRELAGQKELFFPRPMLPSIQDGRIQLSQYKRLKKRKAVRFLPLSWLEQLICADISWGKLEDRLLHLDDDPDLKESFQVPVAEIFSTTHNTIDRVRGGTLSRNGTGQLFQTDERHLIRSWHRNGEWMRPGLFFLAQGNIERLSAALRLLEDFGIGGDRHIGKGRFSFEIQPFHLRTAEVACTNALLNLSTYIPSRDELAAHIAADHRFLHYRMEERRGWIGLPGTNARKKTHTVFQEGSVFPFLNRNSFGQVAITAAANPAQYLPYAVYQYGFSIMIPMHIVF